VHSGPGQLVPGVAHLLGRRAIAADDRHGSVSALVGAAADYAGSFVALARRGPESPPRAPSWHGHRLSPSRRHGSTLTGNLRLVLGIHRPGQGFQARAPRWAAANSYDNSMPRLLGPACRLNRSTRTGGAPAWNSRTRSSTTSRSSTTARPRGRFGDKRTQLGIDRPFVQAYSPPQVNRSCTKRHSLAVL
jgi:hypothetical protein